MSVTFLHRQNFSGYCHLIVQVRHEKSTFSGVKEWERTSRGAVEFGGAAGSGRAAESGGDAEFLTTQHHFLLVKLVRQEVNFGTSRPFAVHDTIYFTFVTCNFLRTPAMTSPRHLV